jgi:hypothetical protein
VICLADLLNSADPETLLLSLRTLGRLQTLPDASIPRAAQLCESPDARVALRARLALYLARPDQRARWFAPLVESLKSADDSLAIDALLAMYRTDKDRQLPILALLVERVGRVEIKNEGRWMDPGYLGQVVGLGWDVVRGSRSSCSSGWSRRDRSNSSKRRPASAKFPGSSPPPPNRSSRGPRLTSNRASAKRRLR